jgi:hypothetical protein
MLGAAILRSAQGSMVVMELVEVGGIQRDVTIICNIETVSSAPSVFMLVLCFLILNPG